MNRIGPQEMLTTVGGVNFFGDVLSCLPRSWVREVTAQNLYLWRPLIDMMKPFYVSLARSPRVACFYEGFKERCGLETGALAGKITAVLEARRRLFPGQKAFNFRIPTESLISAVRKVHIERKAASSRDVLILWRAIRRALKKQGLAFQAPSCAGALASTMDSDSALYYFETWMIENKAQVEQIREISIKDNTFTGYIPDCVLMLKGVVSLSVKSSGVKNLSENLLFFKNLQNLNLQLSDLTAVPVSVDDLEHLKSLQVSVANNDDLQSHIDTMPVQTQLRIMTRVFEALPGNIGGLVSKRGSEVISPTFAARSYTRFSEPPVI